MSVVDDAAQSPVMGTDGKPRVYARRFAVLAALAINYLTWNMSMARHVPVSPSFARYMDVPNESFDGTEVGIDFFTTFDSILLIVSYFACAMAVDRWGLRMMIVGSGGIALGNVIWYLADDSYWGVIAGRSFASLLGPLVSTSLLSVSNTWFPESERAQATATTALLSLLGSGAALLVSPQFATNDEQILDLELKSCKADELDPAVVLAYNAALAVNQTVDCVGSSGLDDAKELFCCYLPVDIPTINLVNLLITATVFVFTFVAVKDRPPTPPSASALPKESVGLFKGLRMLFGTESFAKLALSDFIVSAPVQVLFYAIARMFPSSISDLSFYASAGGIAVAIPLSIWFAKRLDRTKSYYSYTFGGYASGAVAWIVATIAFVIGGWADWIFFGMVVVASALFIAWQTAVYETKMEYVFNPDVNNAGLIVASDRIIFQISRLASVSTLAPEIVGSARNTYIIGCAIMLLGLVPVALIRNKYLYRRVEHELQHAGEPGHKTSVLAIEVAGELGE